MCKFFHIYWCSFSVFCNIWCRVDERIERNTRAKWLRPLYQTFSKHDWNFFSRYQNIFIKISRQKAVNHMQLITPRPATLLKCFCTSDYCSFYIKISHRSSLQEVFCKKDFIRNLVKFTGKHLCQSLIFNKRDSGTGILLRILRNC